MTILKDELRELAERVEAATGPDRELDGEIDAAIERWPEGWSRDSFLETVKVEFHSVGNGRVGIRADGGLDQVRWNAPYYSASLDAAMQLVPEDYDWAVFRTNGGLTMHAWCGDKTDVFAATPALALTAAALRARASIKGSSDATE